MLVYLPFKEVMLYVTYKNVLNAFTYASFMS